MKLGRRRHLRKSLGRPSPEAFFPYPRAACAASTAHEPPLAPDARHLFHAATVAKPSARPVQRDARQARPGGRQSHPQRDYHAPVRVRHLTAPRPGRRTPVGCGARPCCPGAREGTPTHGAARTAARRLGITRKQLRAIVGSATSRSPKTPKTRPRGPLPRRGPPGCPRRGLPAPTARPRRCGAQRRHRPRRPPSTVLFGVSPADAHHGPAARVTATERYTHMATLQMTDASQRMSELGYRDERSCNPSCHLWLRHKSGPVPECSGRGPVVCGGSGI